MMQTAEKKKRSPLRGRILWGAKLCVSAGIIAFIFYKIFKNASLGEIKTMLAHVPLAGFLLWMAVAFLIKGTGMFMAVVRWRLLLLGQGLKIGWWHLIGSFLIGRFIGSFTPSTTGLDGWRLYDIARHARNTAASVSVILVEKITGFFILSVLILATMPLGGVIIRNEATRQTYEKASAIMVVALGIPMAVAFLMILKPSLIRLVIQWAAKRAGRFAGKFMKFADALSAYEKQKGLLLYALGFGFLVHLATCVMYYFTGHALGLDVALKAVLFIGPIEIAATIIPVSIAGIGVRELVWAVLLGGHLGGGGVAFAGGALLGFLGYAVGEVISLFGGPIWLMRRADYRMMKEGQGLPPAEEDGKAGAAAAPNAPLSSEEGRL
jgi:uncharacterized protein (TIRG00374 family)